MAPNPMGADPRKQQVALLGSQWVWHKQTFRAGRAIRSKLSTQTWRPREKGSVGVTMGRGRAVPRAGNDAWPGVPGASEGAAWVTVDVSLGTSALPISIHSDPMGRAARGLSAFLQTVRPSSEACSRPQCGRAELGPGSCRTIALGLGGPGGGQA